MISMCWFRIISKVYQMCYFVVLSSPNYVTSLSHLFDAFKHAAKCGRLETKGKHDGKIMK